MCPLSSRVGHGGGGRAIAIKKKLCFGCPNLHGKCIEADIAFHRGGP